MFHSFQYFSTLANLKYNEITHLYNKNAIKMTHYLRQQPQEKKTSHKIFEYKITKNTRHMMLKLNCIVESQGFKKHQTKSEEHLERI